LGANVLRHEKDDRRHQRLQQVANVAQGPQITRLRCRLPQVLLDGYLRNGLFIEKVCFKNLPVRRFE
jgi:hypothetical protein